MPTLGVGAAHAQEKVEGKVVSTKLTHCDMNVKIGGCAGTFTMERKAEGKNEELKVNVPLGTPITRGRLCLRGTTDYWVNDAVGRPFFVVSKAVTEGLLMRCSMTSCRSC